MKHFKGRILMVGFGVVGHATLTLLQKRVGVPWSRVTVIDFAERDKALQPWIDRGLRFVRERITPVNMPRLLAAHVEAGGLLVDLTWSIDCFDIMAWARKNGVLYVNASVESWSTMGADLHKSSIEKSLYARYVRLLNVAQAHRASPTAVVDHGANPGLVSHFVKQGLLDVAAHVLQSGSMTQANRKKLERLVEDEEFPELARTLGVRAIHCSEWDRQRTPAIRRPDEFVNTWGVEAMWEEAISPSEIGWGTHERRLPSSAIVPPFGPQNQVILPQMGMNTWVRSWVPDHEIVGMAVTHGESFTISNFLTVRQKGRVVYRPTVHYAYMPADATMNSLHELRCRNYELQSTRRVLTDEITEGEDVVGALIMGPAFRSWWTGSFLDIRESRKHVPHSNATAVQVAAGVLSAILWAIDHPNRGICLPEDLPHRDILRTARSYLGKIVSVRSDWTPLRHHQVYFAESQEPGPDEQDPYQFTNFLFRK